LQPDLIRKIIKSRRRGGVDEEYRVMYVTEPNQYRQQNRSWGSQLECAGLPHDHNTDPISQKGILFILFLLGNNIQKKRIESSVGGLKRMQTSAYAT